MPKTDRTWERATIGVLTATSLRLVKQRDGLKALLDEALDLISREPGLPLETRERIADLFKRREKAYREFGQ